MAIPTNIVLEDSYVLGWKFSNHSFHMIGEFRNIDLEPNPPPKLRDELYFKWEIGELIFTGLKSAKISELSLISGKDGEFDFGSPDIVIGKDEIRIELSQGYCVLTGRQIKIDYLTQGKV